MDSNVLYSHPDDPFELNNLFYDASHQEIKNELHQRSLEWMEKFNDKGVPSSVLITRAMLRGGLSNYPAAPCGKAGRF
jgi:hypothetical protein